MKSNIKVIIFIIICSILLYFTKVKYNDHSLNKSILACVIGQKKTKNMTHEEAKIYCEKEINNKLK
tara:strand:+ start:182 stop:379 length:198 start_codon:yes stop_codon:yes gene_type:complete